ncbi:signal peptide peptidase SppA [Pinisolibacter aquiterrae]|uniref:signal peptide peptidase SppA n=1 Tax=Pinisolibacter aquiterrae TaxID=2815579 RepID=UPI001C3C30BD|nr:signal peptide peptidase SppA [Pinisolibacter aquiterrae]MBV5262853.1 signal peptide peptidase SppA [Pinisolibacter aquiterrae]MCC8236433.1 signal peptide peptidase SppA [Pinisolibacter aquiterrae]
MMLDPDAIADRRRLERRLGRWRIFAILLAVVACAALAVRFDLVGGGTSKTRPHVARIAVKGLMLPDRALIATIDQMAESDAVKGVVVDIDSPGGATTAGEALYQALRRLAAKKPTVTHVGSLAASAGYMAALGTDHIVARRSALTGSIGVLVQWGDVSELMKTVGVKLEEVKSSPMKAEPTPFKPTSPEARAMLDRAIRDTYDWFVGLVAERRGLTRERALELADGRVVTGHQALDLKLVDEIGEESVAVEWLHAKGVASGLPILDWKPKAEGVGWPLAESLAAAATRGVTSALGLEGSIATLRSLDGLQSVWHLGRDENPSNSEGIGR